MSIENERATPPLSEPSARAPLAGNFSAGAVCRTLERPLSAIAANTEYAVGMLSRATDLADVQHGKALAVALESVARALNQIADSTKELSGVVRHLRELEEPTDGHSTTLNPAFSSRHSGLRELQQPRPEVRPSLLVIDDEPAIVGSIHRILKDRYEITLEFSASSAASRLLSGERYDLILCDITMPNMSGIELFDVVTESRRELAGRFVFMTGGMLSPEASRFFESAPNVLVQKPFTLAVLLAALEGALQLHGNASLWNGA